MRQPWLVSGVLKTVDAVTKVPQVTIGISLTMYLLLYAFLLAAFVTTLFYMAKKAGEKPKEPPAPASGEAIVEAIQG